MMWLCFYPNSYIKGIISYTACSQFTWQAHFSRDHDRKMTEKTEFLLMCERQSAPRRHAYRAGHCWHCERSVRSVRLLSVPGGQALFGALGLEEPGGQTNLSKMRDFFFKNLYFNQFQRQIYTCIYICVYINIRRWRNVSPWHAVHVWPSESHLRAGFSCVALPAVGQLVLTLQWVKSARWTRNGVACILRTVETRWTFEAVLHT